LDDRTAGRRAVPIIPGSGIATPRPERHSIQSVDRAIRLLEAIAEAGGECSLTELSQRT